MKLTHFALSLVVAAALAGCGSTVKLDDKPVVENKDVTPHNDQNLGAQSQGTSESSVKTVDLSSELRKAVEAYRVIYFDFDSDVVKPEYQGTIEKHANRLAKDPKVNLMLEGHTDERGGREYNLALGQRRAESVAKSLALLGVQANRVEAVSFGMERPAVQGSDEAAWAKNRRVEIKDK